MRRLAGVAPLGVLLLVELSATTAGAQGFRRPVACDDCISRFYYVDHEEGGGTLDWDCQNETYDGHRGTDYSLRGGNNAIDSGNDVVAMADGVVVSSEDGYFDRCTSCQAQNCGLDFGDGFANQVRIDHGEYVVIYGHMRLGSVLVTDGDPVTCGQPIGQIGSSGCSSGAHLHVEPRLPGGDWQAFADPYAGACSPTALSMFLMQGEHRELPGAACSGAGGSGGSGGGGAGGSVGGAGAAGTVGSGAMAGAGGRAGMGGIAGAAGIGGGGSGGGDQGGSAGDGGSSGLAPGGAGGVNLGGTSGGFAGTSAIGGAGALGGTASGGVASGGTPWGGGANAGPTSAVRGDNGCACAAPGRRSNSPALFVLAGLLVGAVGRFRRWPSNSRYRIKSHVPKPGWFAVIALRADRGATPFCEVVVRRGTANLPAGRRRWPCAARLAGQEEERAEPPVPPQGHRAPAAVRRPQLSEPRRTVAVLQGSRNPVRDPL